MRNITVRKKEEKMKWGVKVGRKEKATEEEK